MFLLHRAGSSLPPIRPCDTAKASDTKTHWSAKELHWVIGCWNFCNYKDFLQVSRDGQLVDGGEFPPLLESCITIPKAKCGLLLDWTFYHYLDAVHMDIVFGNCLSVSGFQYALILVDCAMRYNWMFGLKSLSSEYILGALPLFVLLLVLLPDAFPWIAILSCLVLLLRNISLTTILKLSWLRLSNNLPTVWWSIIGRLWSTWPGRISPTNKCHAVTGSLPFSMQLRWWTLFLESSGTVLPCPFSLSMVLVMMNGHGYPCSPCATFIMKKTMMIPEPNIWLTQWLASLLDILPIQMLLCYSILGMANIMSQNAAWLICIVSLAWSILHSNPTGVSSAHCSEMIIQPLKRSILPGQGLNGLIHPQISSLRRWSWIFPSQFLLPKLTDCSLTPSSLIMAPLLLYHLMKWPVSFLCRLSRFAIWTCTTISCLRSSALIQKSPMNTRGNTIEATDWFSSSVVQCVAKKSISGIFPTGL